LADGLLTIGVCPSVWSTDGPGVNRTPFVRPLPALSGGGGLIVSHGQTLSSLSGGGMMDVDSLVLLDLVTICFHREREKEKSTNKQTRNHTIPEMKTFFSGSRFYTNF
jgi:hypothetical protein